MQDFIIIKLLLQFTKHNIYVKTYTITVEMYNIALQIFTIPEQM